MLTALSHAAEFLDERATRLGAYCDDCAAGADEPCELQRADFDLATRYRAAAIRLGDDR
jgi:hypothetical protein